MTEETLSQPIPRKSAISGAAIRRFLGFVHLWVGLICGLPFIALGISGSVLMLGHDLPITGMAHSNTNNLAALVEAAKPGAPEGARPISVDLPSTHGDPALVRFALPRNDGAAPAPGPRGGISVLVDPTTMTVQKNEAQGAGGLMRFMHDIHGRMLIEGPSGRSLVGWLGVFMTFLGLSGIVLWWPKPHQWRNAFTFGFGRFGLKFNRDMHGAVGIWGLIVFLIVSFSGVYIAFPLTLNDVFGAGKVVREARGFQGSPVKVAPIEGETPIEIDDAVALARGDVSDALVRQVQLPAAPNQPYRVIMSRAGDGNNAPRVTVFVDQWAKRVAEVRDPRQYSAADTFLTWQRPLHTGLGLGWIWWSLVFLSGFLPLLFVITGFSMWFIKRRNKRRVMAQ